MQCALVKSFSAVTGNESGSKIESTQWRSISKHLNFYLLPKTCEGNVLVPKGKCKNWQVMIHIVVLQSATRKFTNF